MAETNKTKVLVVDDEPGALESFRMILEIKDFEVSTFSSGIEALAAVEKTAFQIAFIDLKMPIMGGLEVLKKLKELSPTTEAVIVTAYASEESQANAITLGAMEYLRKPFLMEEIFSLCDRALRKRREKGASKDSIGGPNLGNIH
ncbi:MAG: response regulator [Candidatus Saganbacteria bacterium]|nr:response regulator [Candidatus Saganbacteria bacterium]